MTPLFEPWPKHFAEEGCGDCMNKVYANADAAIADVPDGATIMAGGFA